MRIKRLHIAREDRVRYLGWGIRFFLTATLTAAQLPGGGSPFALGCVAASGAGGCGVAALTGTMLGTILFLPFEQGLPHMAVAVLLLTTAVAFQGWSLLWQRWVISCYAGGFYLVVHMAYVLQAAVPAEKLPICLTATVATVFSAWFYLPLLAPGKERLDLDGLYFLAITILVALMEVKAGGVSVGRTLACELVLMAAWQEGMSRGMTLGLCAGVLMDIVGGNGTLFFTAIYGFGGLAAGIQQRKNRFFAVILYLGAGALLLLSATDRAVFSTLKELLVACLLFLMIPGRALGGKRLQKQDSIPQSVVTDGIRDRLTRAAAAFRDLYDSLGRNTQRDGEENPAVIFDRAAEKICRDCALCGLCWKKEYVATFNALNDATSYLLERGRTLSKDYPTYFTDRCIHLTEFLNAVNSETSSFLLRQQYRKELEEARRSARGQYAQLGEILSVTAAGLDHGAPVLGNVRQAYRIGAALRPKEGERICGDSVSAFETENGFLCLLLSDGCGSGEGARRESALTSRLLRQFLEAGIAAESALKTMNTALTLRSTETGSFATIDLLTVGLREGNATLYKYGAAPTYIKKNGSVRRITGSALPIGLRESPAPPDITRLRLETGSFVIMISDGVADTIEDEWLQNLLAGWDGDDPQILAGLILKEAAQRERIRDDCGVQILYLLPEEVQLA